MLDEHGRTEYLSVSNAHKSDCAFGRGFFRLSFAGNVRYCQSWDEVQTACHLLDGVVRIFGSSATATAWTATAR